MRDVLAISVFALVVAGCNCTPTPPATCDQIDEDADGENSCTDCNDNDANIGTGKTEVCDNGADDDCNGAVDAADPACEDPFDCVPSNETEQCGEPGSACERSCQANGTWGECQPPTGPIDVLTDPNNCRTCGRVCPTPVNADARCVAGFCTRGPCQTGFYDLDGDGSGCRWTCVGKTCTDDGGNTRVVDNVPLPERGPVFQALASGSSYGGAVQTSAGYTNFGVLGEPTPPGVGGATEQTSTSYRHIGGLNAIGPQ